jgi:hypothetical protein
MDNVIHVAFPQAEREYLPTESQMKAELRGENYKLPKSYHRHLANAQNKRHVWTEGEILGVRKCIHGLKHADDALTLIMNVNEGGFRITQEQSDFGIQFLRSKLFKKDNTCRTSAFARCFGLRERDIVRQFKKFTFEGVRYQCNPYSGQFSTSPIYRVHSKGGRSFDYTMGHWSLPEVL